MVLDARAYRYVNFTYALVDETGEVHPPKDANRNEITLTPQEMHEIRAQVLSDAAAFSQNDIPLSAAWLRQLGDEEKALMTESMVHNLTTAPPPPLGQAEAAGGPLPGRGHRRRAEGVVPSPMGRVPPQLGGVEDLGRAGRSGGDVGAGALSEEHGGDEGMAWLRRAPADDTPAPSRWSSREQCRKRVCAATINGLKSEVKQLEATLRPLQRMFKSEVDGQVRRVHAEFAEATSKLHDALAAERLSFRLRNAALKNARELASENEQLLSKVAALSCSYASLMGKHASSEKKARVDRRQASQRERQLLAKVALAEQRVKAAERRTEEAVEAEEQALEAERSADERVAEAERAADEALAESQAAAEDAEAARRESSDAEYVRVVLEAKLKRAQARAVERQAKVFEQQAQLLKGPANRTVDEWASLGREAEYKAAQRERRYLS